MWALWNLGPAAYTTGGYAYENPYYIENTVVVEQNPALDYSQPLQVATTAEEEEEEVVSDAAMQQFDAARESFARGDYTSSLSQVNNALKEMPNDSVLHEFRALVLFTLNEYDQAAATIYAVLAVGPGWDWTTLTSLYPDDRVYAQQLRALEKYRNDHPDSSAACFLLAYHYLTAGHAEAAAKQLEEVVKLVPNDELSARLLETISESAQGQPGGAGGLETP